MSREQEIASVVQEMREVANNYGSVPTLERGARVEIAMWADRLAALSHSQAAATDDPWKSAVYLAAGLHVIEADAHEWIVAQAKKLRTAAQEGAQGEGASDGRDK